MVIVTLPRSSEMNPERNRFRLVPREEWQSGMESTAAEVRFSMTYRGMNRLRNRQFLTVSRHLENQSSVKASDIAPDHTLNPD